jgi:hypothetical protein
MLEDLEKHIEVRRTENRIKQMQYEEEKEKKKG